MKFLDGKILATYIKERQLHEVAVLIQEHHIHPKLAIISTIDNPVIDIYMNLKKKYGIDISIDVEIHRVNQQNALQIIERLNNDTAVHGIIVQLPIEDISKTDEITNMVSIRKDVDGLCKDSLFDPATPKAIMWLLAGYNIELSGKDVVLVGRGKLVGAPLYNMLKKSNINAKVADKKTTDLKALTLKADIIVTATGNPGIIQADMIKKGAVVVDAGVASENGKTVGDLSSEVYNRQDIIVTPTKGGVGPLTVCALFDNVIRAASMTVNNI